MQTLNTLQGNLSFTGLTFITHVNCVLLGYRLQTKIQSSPLRSAQHGGEKHGGGCPSCGAVNVPIAGRDGGEDQTGGKVKEEERTVNSRSVRKN